jgi:dihydrofolate reductase
VRALIVNNIISIDGFYSATDGNPLALQMDSAFDRANLESIESADIVLLGRESFDSFSSYWPFIADAPAPADPGAPEARAVDAVNRGISRAYNRIPKVVISDRGPIDSGNAWLASTTVLSRADVTSWVRRAKQEGDGAIVVFASHTLWNALLADALVDELHLMISPNPLGGGVPAFTAPARLELLEARTFTHSSNVQLRYVTR